MRTLIPWMSALILLGCGDKEDTDTADTAGGDTAAATADNTTDFDCEAPTAEECSDDVGFCGNIKVPTDFTGTPRSLAVALYTTVPPAGPPNATLIEIEAPELVPGTCYPVVVHPMLEQGTYHLWVNLYMEGGGSWVPVNGIDYTAFSEEAMELDGTVRSFADLSLELASGW